MTPGEKHRTPLMSEPPADTVLGLVGEQGVPQLIEAPAVQFRQFPGGGPRVGQGTSRELE
jgi:hypothetical protein